MEGDSGSQTNPTDQTNQVNGPPVYDPNANGQAGLPSVQPPVSSSMPDSPKTRKKLSLPVIIALLVLLLVGGSAAAYFGFIAPNQPENIWKSALENTAEAYDEMVDYVAEAKDTKGFKAKGSLKLAGAVTGDGSIEAVSDDKNARIKTDIGFAGSRYGVEALLNTPEGSETPDLFFKVTGLQGISDLLAGSPYAEAGPLVSSLNDQWFFVDHTLFDQMIAEAGESSLTGDDVAEIARKTSEVNREYLFTTDPSKRVLTVVREVGKEERDGRSVYHFEVGFDKENLKSYIRELKSRLESTKLKDLLESSGQSYDEAFNIDDVLRSIDDMKGDETADVWVDMKTKLIRVVRFTDSDKGENNYVELRLPYNGGDEIPFVIELNVEDEDPGNMELGVTVNTDTDVAKFTLDMNYEFSGEKQTIKGDLTVEPSNDTVEFTRPEGAKPIMELIGAFYSGLYGGLGQTPGVDPGSDLLLDEFDL